MTEAATPPAVQTPFPAIREDILSRLSQRAEDMVREKPTAAPQPRRPRWFQ